MIPRSLELEQQKKALNSFLGEGNSVTERMALAGADDQAGLAMQKTIFKQFQAMHIDYRVSSPTESRSLVYYYVHDS